MDSLLYKSIQRRCPGETGEGGKMDRVDTSFFTSGGHQGADADLRFQNCLITLMLKCSCHPLLKVSEAQIPKHTAVIKHYILVWHAPVSAVIVKMKIQNFVNVNANLTHIYKKSRLKKKHQKSRFFLMMIRTEKAYRCQWCGFA